ncbi:MAG: hypothetical protein HKP14_06735, partial [Bacteroidia bacterium]|nr:hypothetical protein [Bacteroidia bacterium]
MKNIFSFVACILVSLVLIQHRVAYTDLSDGRKLNVATWDALGYYLYLPAAIIYNDATELNWFPEIDSTYDVSGGVLYQAQKTDNGNYVFKYLGGVAVMQLPSFLVGHAIALSSDYKADGFSPPYQYSLAFGAILYCILGLFLLRGILLRYFSDLATAVSLVLLVLATNLIQYISIDSIMSHSYIFFLYVMVIYTTIKWHIKPSVLWASLTGLVIGIATICRPTEAIMFLIPLLWNTQNKEASSKKWQLVKSHQSHLIYIAVFGFIGILPQLIYWKLTADTFVFNVGSKWVFLNPFFRVLFGWEKGWFIYTPVVILFIIGFFYIKKFPFRKSVIVFSLLNIWVVIAWFDWRYGATYSTRALTQSYPVFALGFTAIIERILNHKWGLALFPIGIFLVFLNLVQIDQYNSTVLHYNDMNRKYYGKILLDRDPNPIKMSLLDTDEYLNNEKGYKSTVIAKGNDSQLSCTNDSTCKIVSATIQAWSNKRISSQRKWIRIDATIKGTNSVFSGRLQSTLQLGDSSKVSSIRLARPLA